MAGLEFAPVKGVKIATNYQDGTLKMHQNIMCQTLMVNCELKF
jgi:hypothetical protein